jgi:hypothetical protein
MNLFRKIPDPQNRRELTKWCQEDFRKNQHETEEITIKMCMQVGMRSLKELENSLHLSGISTESTSSSQTGSACSKNQKT